MKKVGVPRTRCPPRGHVARTRRPAGRRRDREEPLDVQPQPSGVRREVLQLQGVLVVEQQVVHGPEGLLTGGGLGGHGGQLGVRVDVGQGQMPHDVAQPVAEVLRAARGRLRWRGAERALEVQVLDQRQRRVGPVEVVALRVDRVGEQAGSPPLAEARAASRKVSPSRGAASTAASRMPTTPSPGSGSSSKARPTISSATVKPIPDRAAPPRTWPARLPAAAARARAGRASRRRSRSPRTCRPRVPTHDSPGDGRAQGVAEDAAAQVDAGVGQREQRHDHVGSRGAAPCCIRSLTEIARPGRARAVPLARHRRLAERPDQPGGRLDVRRGAVRGRRPAAGGIPAIDGCRPDCRVASQRATGPGT